jgi:hypothetical protein
MQQNPGHFPTQFGWIDPFRLLSEIDPSGSHIPSVLAQEGIKPEYSGASVVDRDGRLVIEGLGGSGEAYMKGLAGPEPLPARVIEAVAAVHKELKDLLGDVRLEWVYDGSVAWVVQLHCGRTEISGRTVFPGDPEVYHRFDASLGLEALRRLVATIDNRHEGVIIVGNVGLTSHLGDILRRARVASKIEPGPAT